MMMLLRRTSNNIASADAVRKRELSAEDIEHYQKAVATLKETIRLMGEVDEAIESAGGWPIKREVV